MVRRKSIRTRGKIQLSKYFQEFEKGDRVSIVREKSLQVDFPERMQGRTGVVEGKRGNSVIVKLNDYNKEKRFIIEPIHLKKIRASNKDDNKKRIIKHGRIT